MCGHKFYHPSHDHIPYSQVAPPPPPLPIPPPSPSPLLSPVPARPHGGDRARVCARVFSCGAMQTRSRSMPPLRVAAQVGECRVPLVHTLCSASCVRVLEQGYNTNHPTLPCALRRSHLPVRRDFAHICAAGRLLRGLGAFGGTGGRTHALAAGNHRLLLRRRRYLRAPNVQPRIQHPSLRQIPRLLLDSASR